MKLIVGLGNLGEKYQYNRHNVGFMFVDYLVNELTPLRPSKRDFGGASGFKDDKYSHSELAKLVINNKEIILSKPQVFMNRSGITVKQLIKRLKPAPNRTCSGLGLNVESLTVIHDDLDIPLGKFKIQKGSGPKLHNGIESIEKSLGTKDFWRVRIGIDNRAGCRMVAGETYVLKNFLTEERNILLTEVFPKLLSQVKTRLLQ